MGLLKCQPEGPLGIADGCKESSLQEKLNPLVWAVR